MRSSERGAVLVEVLAAVVVLAIAGLAFANVVRRSAVAIADAMGRQEEYAAMDRLIATYSLLRAGDLDQRLGARRAGDYVVGVERPERGLYRIAVSREEDPQAELLVTVVFRPSGP